MFTIIYSTFSGSFNNIWPRKWFRTWWVEAIHHSSRNSGTETAINVSAIDSAADCRLIKLQQFKIICNLMGLPHDIFRVVFGLSEYI